MSLVPLYKNEATRLPLPSSNHPPPLSLVTTTQTKASSNAAVKVPRDGDALFLSPPVKTEKSKQRKVESQLSSNSSQGRLPIVTPAQIDRNATSPTSSRSEESSSAPTRQDGNNGLILACLALPDKTQLQVVTYADRKEAMKRNSFGEIVYNLICEAEAKDPAMMRWTCDGEAFVVDPNHPGLKNLLSKYFMHSKFSSFQRQLNTYGWNKCRTGRYQGCFYNAFFHRDRSSSVDLSKIRRNHDASLPVKNKPTRLSLTRSARILTDLATTTWATSKAENMVPSKAPSLHAKVLRIEATQDTLAPVLSNVSPNHDAVSVKKKTAKPPPQMTPPSWLADGAKKKPLKKRKVGTTPSPPRIQNSAHVGTGTTGSTETGRVASNKKVRGKSLATLRKQSIPPPTASNEATTKPPCRDLSHVGKKTQTGVASIKSPMVKACPVPRFAFVDVSNTQVPCSNGIHPIVHPYQDRCVLDPYFVSATGYPPPPSSFSTLACNKGSPGWGFGDLLELDPLFGSPTNILLQQTSIPTPSYKENSFLPIESQKMLCEPQQYGYMVPQASPHGMGMVLPRPKPVRLSTPMSFSVRPSFSASPMDPFPLDTRAARTLFAEDINGASPLTGVPKSKSEIFTTEVPSERRAGSPLPYSRSLSDFLNGWAPGVPPSA